MTPEEKKAQDEKDLLEKVNTKAKEALKGIEDAFELKMQEALKGKFDEEKFKEFETSINTTLETVKNINLDEIKKGFNEKLEENYNELKEILKTQGDDLTNIKTSGGGDSKKVNFFDLDKKGQMEFLAEKAIETDEYKEWVKKGMKGSTTPMSIKDIISITDDHTGDIFITESRNNIRDIPRAQSHLRDVISVVRTDEDKITFGQVTDYNDIYNLGTQMLAENEEITDVGFKTSEISETVKRLGVSMDVSKRYFRGSSKIFMNHILAQLPDAMLFKEDTQILFGDNSGNNLDGIITDARQFALPEITIGAGDIVSYATYDSGTKTKITFKSTAGAEVPHQMLNGDNITLANTTNYNGKHEEVIVLDQYNIVINEVYVGGETATNFTGSTSSYWKETVTEAQEFDVLSAALSILEAGLYEANAIWLNPQTVKKIGILKGTDADYVGVTRDASGRLNVDGVPILSHNRIPAGWFLVGDFSAKTIQISDYTSMTIQFAEDVSTKKKNSIVVIVEEEIHLTKYNPQWYIFDRFSTSKTIINEPTAI